MNKKKILLILLIVAYLLIKGVAYAMRETKRKEKNLTSDSTKFAEEYKMTDKNGKNIDNAFTYRSMNQIIKILENGTGIVYLGFPECPWCQQYVYYLNEVAKSKGLEKVYYRNILNDRKNNTSEYQKVVSLLNDYLQYDEEGNKRLYVPAVIAVKDGKIVGFDDETAWDTKGYKTPADYWKNEDLGALKKKLGNMIDAIDKNICTSNCNK